ncbi:MAG: helicase-related protein [Chloroflexota bacterium]|nr:helicase-related protein [Chloroflexota bacterium]
MNLPYVIDNRADRLADVLNDLLDGDAVHALDVATAYFNVGGFDLLREGLEELASFRLLLGSQPGGADELGLRRWLGLRRAVRRDLEEAPLDQETYRQIEALTRFLRREEILVRLYEEGFLHAKAYLCFADDAPGDRFIPVAGIVGSSNFTRAGLTTNQELNLTHKTVIEEGEADDVEAQAAVEPLLDRPPRFSADGSGYQVDNLEQSRAAGEDQHEKPRRSLDTQTRRAVKSEVGARAILELLDWYDARWSQARDFKRDLIELLNESKFGGYEYTPYQIYLKTLYEYFREEVAALTGDDGLRLPGTRSAVELTRFQEDAVRKARRILARYDGVMVADSVGLGKTWIGKKLLEDTAYHRRQKALVVCPASLRDMWRGELQEAAIPARIVSQELLGQEDFLSRSQAHALRDVDVILIDESHNFRNHNTNRYENLERLVGANRGRGRDGERKKVILLTATPINNTILDLYYQLMLFAQGDRTYFSAAGIGDLRKYFLAARRQSTEIDGSATLTTSASETAALFNLLEEVVIRRTRTYVRKAYPQATIRGEPINWPERELETVRYNLEETYQGIYDDVVAGIESLTLAPYSLEDYKQVGIERDVMELGREQALVGIFKSRFLKRFESSVEAFRISVGRALAFFKTFADLLDEGKLLDSSEFRHAMRYLEPEAEDDAPSYGGAASSDGVAAPRSQAGALDDHEAARAVLEELPGLDVERYDLARLREAVAHDVARLTEIWERVEDITPERDAKLKRIKALLTGDLRGKKVVLFAYYRDTARYLHRELQKDEAFVAAAGDPRIAIMDGDVDPATRSHRLVRFAPVANNRPELAGSEGEIDLMISTDVLSEGQNLQDCGYLVNYDLHWNPTRMVQRAGRIDRIGSLFETLCVYNVFPERGLERLLQLVSRLQQKITTIDQFGMLETSVLGEVVHPRTFNHLQRIADEDESVMDELQAESELASSEFLMASLQDALASGEWDLEALPDGIHSGRERDGYRGLFFYFTAPPVEDPSTGGSTNSPGASGQGGEARRHFWRYYDLKSGRILDNRYEIARLIRCGPDEPRVLGEGVDVFEIQDRVIEDILGSVRNQQAIEAAPKILDSMQQLVATELQGQLNNPAVASGEVREALRTLREPLPRAYVSDLRDAYDAYRRDGDLAALLGAVQEVETAEEPERDVGVTEPLTRDELHLVCWEWVWS